MANAAASSGVTRFITGLEEIAAGYDAIFCDVWGVLHNGLRAHPAAAQALTLFRAADKPVILISNAPRPGHSVIAQLDRLGVPRSAYDDILTSGDLTRAIVRGARWRAGFPPRPGTRQSRSSTACRRFSPTR